MKNVNPDVDAYIAKSADFARPILKKLRELFHQACPQIEETIKWGFPHFEYKGIVASMAAFKGHASFGFWKGKLLKDPHNVLAAMDSAPMSMAKLSDVSELPADRILLDYIREAVALNEHGVKNPPRKKRVRRALEIPGWLVKALKQNKKALATFEAFSPSNKREYVEWLTQAKQESTRMKRLASAIEWMAEGKTRNWKYERKK
ncbi:MAG TPA: YdeI/OmpD-associated family protein [Planctomycetaceae bacterium]|nr:YdeI/OmpD-associated family protein [Planctomycetaceae bacterium]